MIRSRQGLEPLHDAGREAVVGPIGEEAAGLAIAEDTARAARAVSQPKLNPPRCCLARVIGEENSARGALPPSAAKSSLTRDARAKARRQRQAMLSAFPLLAFAAR